MIDRVLGNSYRIVEKVGEGGMGAVYRAVDLMLDRDMAIKAIRPELARDPEIAERFRSEARGVQVDRLMNQVQPGPEVRQAWQGIRTRWQRVGTIISGLQ